MKSAGHGCSSPTARRCKPPGRIDDRHATRADDLDAALGPDDHRRVLVDAEAEVDLPFRGHPGEPAEPAAALIEVLIDDASVEKTKPGGDQQAAMPRVLGQSEVERIHAFVEPAVAEAGGGDHRLALHCGAGAAAGNQPAPGEEFLQCRQGRRVGAVGLRGELENPFLVAAHEVGRRAAADLGEVRRGEGSLCGVFRADVKDRDLAGGNAVQGQGLGKAVRAAGVIGS